MFLLGLFFLNFSEAKAWDPDYAYDLPKQRRMCVERLPKGKVKFSSIFSDEECPKTAQRYIVIFAKKPRGAMGLIGATTSQKFYPPLTLKWPTKKNPSRTQLWHFTCVTLGERRVLDSKIQLYEYLGEYLADDKVPCLEAENRARKYCEETLKGQILLEACPIPWGG